MTGCWVLFVGGEVFVVVKMSGEMTIILRRSPSIIGFVAREEFRELANCRPLAGSTSGSLMRATIAMNRQSHGRPIASPI